MEVTEEAGVKEALVWVGLQDTQQTEHLNVCEIITQPLYLHLELQNLVSDFMILLWAVFKDFSSIFDQD